MYIELKNIRKTIKNHEVLKDITLSLEKGKIYGFVGRNGSGKTMILRIISGLVIPTSGELIVDGEDLSKKRSFPKNMSILFDKTGFLEAYNSFDNLKFLAMIQNKATNAMIYEAIEKVGLDPHDKRKINAYSLGMKQKLAIAQSFMEKPDLMILDEPFNSLDEKSVFNTHAILKEENERGATILITSHIRQDIENLCDEVFSLSDGVLSEENDYFENDLPT